MPGSARFGSAIDDLHGFRATLQEATRDDITLRILATARSIGTGQRVGQMIALAIRGARHITRFDCAPRAPKLGLDPTRSRFLTNVAEGIRIGTDTFG